MGGKHRLKIGSDVIGFGRGSRQFRRILQLDLPRLRVFDHDTALGFLTDSMMLEPEQVMAPRNLSGRKLAETETQFVEIFCALAKQLLIDAGLPAFDREMILALPARAATKNRSAQLAVPVVDNVTAGVYLLAYEAAFNLTLEFAKPSPKLEKIKQQAEMLEKSVIEPIRRACRSGPNCIHLLKAAFQQGVPIMHLGESVYQLGTGSMAVLVERSLTQGDSTIGVRNAKDKWNTLRWLRQNGVPTPTSFRVISFEKARDAAGQINYPVVVKPSDRDRSLGVTVDIENDEQLRTAFDAAQKWSRGVLVEERVPGHCHRLVTFRNRFVFAFTRHPKAVVGDGERTVAQLIEKAQTARAKKVAYKAEKAFPLDKEAVDTLAEQDLQPESVPASEQIVCLRRVNTPEDGGHNETITDEVHADNCRLAERISRMFRLESMGLDLISSDPTRPWYETGACITEVNSVPEIGSNSARIYIETMFSEQRGSVPVHCYIGDAAATEKAEAHRARLEQDGVSAMLTSHKQTLGANGEEIRFKNAERLFERVAALQNDTQSEAIVVVIHDDEVLYRGRPMLCVSTVQRVNDSLRSSLDREQFLQVDRIDALIKALEDGIPMPSEAKPGFS
ncbi:hypothetical protein [Sulfitobacter sp. JB4-11]|uniref:hypothetical protein n=1 Tax=Sulfitobacter rhodophyticola TaxID=3238304 RepID=UPI003D815D56